MQLIKKYAAILIILLIYPFTHFVASNFILEDGDEIYAYIPQESDLVVEINLRNFVSEIAYQRLFQEEYFMEKVYPSEDHIAKPKYVETGLDPFGKIILFREQWANETIWIGVFKYSNQTAVKNFIATQFDNVHYEFSHEFVIVQLSTSNDQDKLSDHIKKIALKEVKSFNERASLSSIFNPSKEINCYVIPRTKTFSQVIDGYISFDFLGDQIKIEGNFTPISNFNESIPIAYKTNENVAFSLRSSLNIFNSIYWFNDEKIGNIPEYTQLAFDYDGVDCKMIHRDMGYSTPFKSYPKINLHFDILKKDYWYAFMETFKKDSAFNLDTINHTITTQEGAHFKYVQNDRIFELTQDSVQLIASTDDQLFFDLRLNVAGILDGTNFTVDTENPPSELEQRIGIMAANAMLGEIRLLASIESGKFHLKGNEAGEIIAEGAILMNEKNGSALIESLSLSSAVFTFIKSYLGNK